jgi:hypothetical protein
MFQSWAIAQAIIDMFLPIVKLCVLNQNAGYWLLLNALHSAFTLCITRKTNVAKAQTLNQPLIHGDFDSKLQDFKSRTMTQVINILSPFLAFASTCDPAKVHNMLVIMLDLHFKNMKVI